MKVSQFDGFVNNATDEILGVKGVNRENLEPMLSTSLAPNITPLIATHNGVYYPDTGIDGFAPVWVDVTSPTPPAPEPVINPLSVTENGTYTAPTGVDGYSPITVNVPAPEPVINSLSITENGTYTAPTGVDGYSPITVNVPAPEPVINSLSITENGTYTAPTGVDGYSPITVNVPSTSGNFAEWDFVQNQATWKDIIRDISISHSASNTYEMVENGIKVIDSGFYLSIPYMYCMNMVFTIEFSKFVMGSNDIRVVGVGTASNQYNYSWGLYFSSSNIGKLTGASTSSGSTANTVNVTGLTSISDGDSIGFSLLSSYKWDIYKNGTKIATPSSCYLNPQRLLYYVTFGTSSASNDFEVGTIIRRITLS